MGPLKQEICFSLNEMNNIPKVSNDVPSINSSGNPFIGTFATGGFFMIDGPFTGKSYGCHKDTLGGGTGYYWFHYAILAR